MALSPRHSAAHSPATASPATLAYIGLGANLGAAAQTLRAAAQALAGTAGIEDLRLSPLYDTSPVGCTGPDYVNAVAEIHTRLDAPALLAVLQAIEQAHGRERPYRNAPRTLDLDLLWYGGQSLDAPGLIVPHPRMHERAFVLRPLMDLAPDLVLPHGELATLLAACTGQTIRPLPDQDPQEAPQTPSHPRSPMPSLPHLRLVVAYTDNRVIGRDGGMPWHLPGDLAHFKRSTLGHPILMGRKTWLSLGRPLPGRRNLVLSRDAGFSAPGAERFESLEAAMAACAGAEHLCIIGGEQIFRQALPLADELIATEIHATIEGDTWFPEPPAGQWQEIERLPQPADHGLNYDFVTYRRIR